MIVLPMATRRRIPLAGLLAPLLGAFRCALAQSSATSSPSDHYTAYFGTPSFNPTMAIVIVFLLSAFFFVGFLSIYIRHCAGSTGADPRGPGSTRSRRRQAVLSPEALEAFPTLVYAEVKGLKVGKGALECAVCLSEFEDDDALRLLPPCSHAFHPQCIDHCPAPHITCPVCRCDLAEATSADAGPYPPAIVAAGRTSPEARPHPLERREQEAPQSPPDLVTILVDQAPAEEDNESAQVERQRRDLAPQSGRQPQKLPRSHSTGHSMFLPEENVDRYTLRLPEHVRREIFASRRLHRSTSCLAFPTVSEESLRRGAGGGCGGAGEASVRGGRVGHLGWSDRWPSFFIRTLSARVPAWATGRRAEGVEGLAKKWDAEGSSSGKFGTVRTPFNCLGGGVDAAGGAKSIGAVADGDESSTAALPRV